MSKRSIGSSEADKSNIGDSIQIPIYHRELLLLHTNCRPLLLVHSNMAMNQVENIVVPSVFEFTLETQYAFPELKSSK